MRQIGSRCLSLLLAMVLAIGLMPSVAFATGSADEEVSLGSVSEPTEIIAGRSYSINVIQDQFGYFTFTTSDAGWYTFASSSSDCDPMVWLYSSLKDLEDNQYFFSSDDHNGLRDFSATCQLEANQTIYLKAGGNSGYPALFSLSAGQTDLYDISNYQASVEDHCVSSGDELSAVLSLGEVALNQGSDYKYAGYLDGEGVVVDSMPASEGYYTAVFTGIGDYTGQLTTGFTVYAASDLYYATVTYDGREYLGDWPETALVDGRIPAAIKVIAADGAELVENEHYKVCYYAVSDTGAEAPVEKISGTGDYVLRIEATDNGGYENSHSERFTVFEPYDFSEAEVRIGQSFFSYTGQPITPEVFVTYNGYPLTENDYTVAYGENCAGDPDQEVEVAITVTPKGSYAGDPRVVTYTISPYQTIEGLISWGDYYVKWGLSTSSMGDPYVFLSEGRPIAPIVVLGAQYPEEEPEYVQGVDYDVSYATEGGTGLGAAPSQPGDYLICIKAREGSSLRGEAQLEMSIVEKIDINNVNFGVNGGNYSVEDGVYTLHSEDVDWRVEGYVGDGIWSWNSTFVEGYDYSLETAEGENGVYTATFTALSDGRLTGVKVINYTIDSAVSLPEWGWIINGVHVDVWSDAQSALPQILVGEYGSVLAPTVLSSDDCFYGIDYELAGYADENGVELDTVSPGELVKVVIRGLGEYEGETVSLYVQTVLDEGDVSAEEISLDSGFCYMTVQAPSYWDSDIDATTFYWLKGSSDLPEVFLGTNSGDLVEGVHYQIEADKNTDENVLTLTASAIEGSGYVGSRSMQLQLVDQYDLSLVAYLYMEHSIFEYPKDAEVLPDYQFGIADSWTGGILEELKLGVDYDLELYGPSGDKVDYPTADGTYTLTLVGKGSYTGSVSEEFLAQARGVGEIPLSNGWVEFEDGDDEFLYTGQGIEPSVSVSVCGITLQEDEDYSVSYHNNMNVGSAYALVTANSGSSYYGSVAVPFRIVESLDLSMAEIMVKPEEGGSYVSLTFAGQNIPAVQMKQGGATLDLQVWEWRSQDDCEVIDPSNYTVTYGNNTAPGVAWVKVEGTGSYTGSLRANFLVVGANDPEGALSIEGACGDVSLETLIYGYEAGSSRSWSVVNSGATNLTDVSTRISSEAAGFAAVCFPDGFDGTLDVGESVNLTVSAAAGLDAGRYGSFDVFIDSAQTDEQKVAAVEFEVAKASQATPVGLGAASASADVSNGKITGLNPSLVYQYGPAGSTTWRDVPTGSAEVAGLSAGMYQVRVAGSKNYEASQSVTVVISAVYAKDSERLSGEHRYETMAAISAEGFAANSCEWAIVASGQNFPDALAASSLAGALDAPVLLTSPNALSDEALSEIRRIGASRVIIVGGEAAIGSNVHSQIRNISTVSSVERVYGDNRYDTAVAIYEKGKALGVEWSDTAIVTTGQNFADALSVSPYAYATASPIFLADPGAGLNSRTASAISSGRFGEMVVLGGTSAVPSSVDGFARNLGLSLDRFSGADRYETSRMIADWATSTKGALGVTYAGFATGYNFPDALAGGALCGSKVSVLLLVESPSSTTISWFADRTSKVERAYVLGGSAVVSSSIEETLNSLLGN